MIKNKCSNSGLGHYDLSGFYIVLMHYGLFID